MTGRLILLTSLLTIFAGTHHTVAAQEQGGYCPATCARDVEVAGTGMWMITELSSSDGTGSQPYCVTCTNCTAHVYCSFLGDANDIYAWNWPGPPPLRGNGVGGGVPQTLDWNFETACDGLSVILTLKGTHYPENTHTTQSVYLICPCTN